MVLQKDTSPEIRLTTSNTTTQQIFIFVLKIIQINEIALPKTKLHNDKTQNW